MNVAIRNATLDDLQIIYHLFEEAILFQQKNNYIGWLNYDKEFIRKDVEENLLYKVTTDSKIVCIFSICYADALIWREKENGDAIYLHRIVLNREYQGVKIFQIILDWGVDFASEKKLKYIRMDTWASNSKLIDYYKSYGFEFVENYTTANTEALPIQHRNLKVALLELCLSSISNKIQVLNDNTQIAEQQVAQKINILNEFSTIHTYWNQKIIGVANGVLIKLAKGIGEINWHKHDDQDELFILYKGHLTIQMKDKNIDLFPNEMYIVPKGTEHCPNAHGEVEFLIMGLNITSNEAGGKPKHFS